ncbi:hypothetical protein SAMN06266787_11917 [Halorubrum ezzemoulense]|uniref:Uncharacterized protein n=1 Tax=Halorubrum ezzemoulense TaxID=337243 RepID=A0A238YU72_HALEZ|nr:hypothetical protein SAMN06266787_11917 [Halorubrum ezzemoulense]
MSVSVNIGGLLQPLNTLAQLSEVRALSSGFLQRSDIGERFVDTVVFSLATEVEVAPIFVEAPECRLGDAGVVSDSRKRLTAVDAGEGLASMEEFGRINAEVPIFDDEPRRRSPSPLSGGLCSPDARPNSLKVLLVFYLGEVAHQPSNHAVYCLLELAVVDVNLQADVEGFDAGIVFQAVLDEFVNLSRTEPREPADLMNNHEIEPSLLNVFEEVVVHLASVGVGGAGDNFRILLNVFDTETL